MGSEGRDEGQGEDVVMRGGESWEMDRGKAWERYRWLGENEWSKGEHWCDRGQMGVKVAG